MAMATTIESVVGRVQTEPGCREWAIPLLTGVERMRTLC